MRRLPPCPAQFYALCQKFNKRVKPVCFGNDKHMSECPKINASAFFLINFAIEKRCSSTLCVIL